VVCHLLQNRTGTCQSAGELHRNVKELSSVSLRLHCCNSFNCCQFRHSQRQLNGNALKCFTVEYMSVVWLVLSVAYTTQYSSAWNCTSQQSMSTQFTSRIVTVAIITLYSHRNHQHQTVSRFIQVMSCCR